MKLSVLFVLPILQHPCNCFLFATAPFKKMGDRQGTATATTALFATNANAMDSISDDDQMNSKAKLFFETTMSTFGWKTNDSNMNKNHNINGRNGEAAVATRKVYCDLDGCLVNFEKGVRGLFRGGSSGLDKVVMWDRISRSSPGWFERLEWTADGKRLWNAIGILNPDILTGVPPIHSSR